jgi:Protein of unknown function (DUF998)
VTPGGPCPSSCLGEPTEEPALNAVPHAVSPVPGRIAVTGIAVAVAISVDLHLRLAGQVSPIWQTLSEYVYGRLDFGSSAAPLFTVMCLALALGSTALLVGMAKARRSLPVLLLLGVWCAGLFTLTMFEVDPPGAPRSPGGNVHNVAALVAFVALPTAAWLLIRRGTRQCPWEPRRTTIRRLALASAFGVAVVLGSFVWSQSHPEIAVGLFERLLFGIDVALLLTMVRPLLISTPR